MIDNDGKIRRERVFEQIREISSDITQIVDEKESVHKKMNELSVSLQDKRNKLSTLKRLVDVMIKYDCCPTEATLKHEDEITESNTQGDAGMNVGYNSASSTNLISSSKYPPLTTIRNSGSSRI
jgi:hypothetical protein